MGKPAVTLGTRRLTLIPVDDALRAARRAGHLEQALQGKLAPGWDGCTEMLDAWDAAPGGHPSAAGWGPWLGVCEGLWVLFANFYGPPDARGSVEFGYELAPVSRGRGLATEAVGALTDWALGSGAARVTAVVSLTNQASAAVLGRCGFVVDPETAVAPGEVAWYRRRESCTP